jgi:hypothetical protein
LKLEYDLEVYLQKIKTSNSYFHTFINKDSLATGILVLKPGEEDTQTPHDLEKKIRKLLMIVMKYTMLFLVMVI